MTTRLNKVAVRQLIADALIAWLKWRTGKGGSRLRFEQSIEMLAAYLEAGEGPQFKSQVWMQALRITNSWRFRRRVPYQMMARLLTIYDEHLEKPD